MKHPASYILTKADILITKKCIYERLRSSNIKTVTGLIILTRILILLRYTRQLPQTLNIEISQRIL